MLKNTDNSAKDDVDYQHGGNAEGKGRLPGLMADELHAE